MSDKLVNEFVDALVETIEAVGGESGKKYSGPSKLQTAYLNLESAGVSVPTDSPKDFLNGNGNGIKPMVEEYLNWLNDEHPSVFNERQQDIQGAV
jgi:hypothetical protein